MRLFLPICLLIVYHSSWSQQFVDVFKLNYRISPDNSFADSMNSNVDLRDVEAHAFLPFEQEDGDYIIAGSSITQTKVDDLNVKSIALLGGVRNKWNKADSDSWEYMTLIISKLNSDGGKVVSKDVQIGIYSLFYSKRREGLKWKFGLYANSELSGFMIVPLFGTEWQINESVKLDMTLPLTASIRKTVNERLMLGVSYVGRKYSYNLSRANEYLEVADNTVCLFSDVSLSERIIFNIEIGHSVLRSYDRYDEGDGVIVSFGAVDVQDERKALNADLSQGLIFKGGLFYRFSAD